MKTFERTASDPSQGEGSADDKTYGAGTPLENNTDPVGWLAENSPALQCSNEFVERYGLPLARYRHF